MGSEDLPAIFEHIEKITGREKIAVVAHHEGTTQVFHALDSLQQFFKNRVSLFVALSPTAKITDTESDLIKLTSKKVQIITEAETLFNSREVFGPTWGMDRSSVQFCNMLPLMCTVLETYIEHNTSYDDRDRHAVYKNHYPSSSPLRSLLHFA